MSSTSPAMKAYAEQHEWMHKFAWLAGKLKLGPAELTFFQGNPDFVNFDWKNFDFAAWLRLTDTVALRDGRRAAAAISPQRLSRPAAGTRPT